MGENAGGYDANFDLEVRLVEDLVEAVVVDEKDLNESVALAGEKGG